MQYLHSNQSIRIGNDVKIKLTDNNRHKAILSIKAARYIKIRKMEQPDPIK